MAAARSYPGRDRKRNPSEPRWRRIEQHEHVVTDCVCASLKCVWWKNGGANTSLERKEGTENADGAAVVEENRDLHTGDEEFDGARVLPPWRS